MFSCTYLTHTFRMTSSEEKVYILITGANQGLGFTTVRQLLRQADNLHIYVGARDRQKGEEAVQKFQDQKDKRSSNSVEFLEIDLTKDESIEKASKQIKQLDILVNNAGISGGMEDLSSASSIRTQMLKVFDTNVFGTAAVTQAFLPLLQDGKHAKKPAIINVSSDLGSFGNQQNPDWKHYKIPLFIYPSSKSALDMATVMYAKNYPQLRVISVNPGYTATNFNGNTGYKTPDEGASAITHAILNFDGPTGIFVEEQGETVPW